MQHEREVQYFKKLHKVALVRTARSSE